ncbi:hypothetical protein [uncultured Dokdonia sp.]|uniref:hypothetical protein n=1 Tax=uncultured Dokdonia sp. TaxID=575653 RepID=UPI00262713E4|nr:hypothetical protein [uncultured Dokdonia sp.]
MKIMFVSSLLNKVIFNFQKIPTSTFLEYGLLGSLFVVALIVIRYLYMENKQLHRERIEMLERLMNLKNEDAEKYVASVGALRELIMNYSITTKGYLEKHISKEHKDICDKITELKMNYRNG